MLPRGSLLGGNPLNAGPHVGWDGDSYRTYDTGDTTCTAATVVMATAAQRDAVRRALPEGWSSRPDGSTGLRLDSCGG